VTAFTIVTDDQRTDAWKLARVGRLTASRACDMLATIKSGEAAARRDLRAQLVVERLTGLPQDDTFVSQAMQRGIDREGDARAAFEAATGMLVQPVGFLAHPELMAGCSPDGIIGPNVGVLEIKCPKSATHLGILRSRTVPKDYLAQLTHALWITGAEWASFVSWDGRFPPPLQLFTMRISRASLDVDAYELAARLFLSEVDREFNEVVGMVAA
jgi:predicted phage-related endonuclease